MIRVDRTTLSGLRQYFGTSERKVYAYRHPGGSLKYMPIFPEQQPLPRHRDHPDYVLVGRVDLATGIIGEQLAEKKSAGIPAIEIAVKIIGAILAVGFAMVIGIASAATGSRGRSHPW